MVIVRFPESMVVPFFFTFTSKLPPTGSVPSEIASFENVTHWESLTTFATPAIATPEEEYSRTCDGQPHAEGVYASSSVPDALSLTDCPADNVIAVVCHEDQNVANVLAVDVCPEEVQARSVRAG